MKLWIFRGQLNFLLCNLTATRAASLNQTFFSNEKDIISLLKNETCQKAIAYPLTRKENDILSYNKTWKNKHLSLKRKTKQAHPACMVETYWQTITLFAD